MKKKEKPEKPSFQFRLADKGELELKPEAQRILARTLVEAAIRAGLLPNPRHAR